VRKRPFLLFKACALEKATKSPMFGEDGLKALEIAVECMQQLEE
jgi:hypothetical protein